MERKYRRGAYVGKEKNTAVPQQPVVQPAEAAFGAAMGRARIARDMEWDSQHSGDTDDQLLNYVSRCEEELHRTPFQSEVTGGARILPSGLGNGPRRCEWRDCLRTMADGGRRMPDRPPEESKLEFSA